MLQPAPPLATLKVKWLLEERTPRKALKDQRNIFQLSLQSPPPYLDRCVLQGDGWKRSERLPCRNHDPKVTSRNVF